MVRARNLRVHRENFSVADFYALVGSVGRGNWRHNKKTALGRFSVVALEYAFSSREVPLLSHHAMSMTYKIAPVLREP